MAESMELGAEFNLRENNPDPGGGLLYAVRYSPDMLDLKTEQVLDALDHWGYEFIEHEDQIGFRHVEGGPVEERAVIMLGELSVINDAKHYQALGWGVNHESVGEVIRDAQGMALDAFDRTLRRDSDAKIEAYDMATLHLPQLIRDLAIADAQNGVLSTAERHALDGLADTASFIGRALDGRRIIIGA